MSNFFNKFDLKFAGYKIGGKYVLIGLGALSVAFHYKLRQYVAGGWCNLSKDLTGKNIVITGGNDGIGKQTARRLVELNANVIIGSRDEKKNNQTVEELSKLGKGKITAFKLDLADRDSIQNFAARVNEQLSGQPLQYLLNNAGLFSIPEFKKTKQNFEMQIGVNHFGHFYLTYLLWKKLKQSNNPRIVNVSSNSHQSLLKSHDLDMNNLHFQNGGYNSYAAYSHSKKANNLFTKQLQKRINNANINGTAISLHPGPVRTGITKQINSNLTGRILLTLATPFLMLAFKTPIEGAQTNIYCILEDDANLVKGGYYKDCKIAKTKSPQVEDPLLAQKLWIESEKAFGIKFDI